MPPQIPHVSLLVDLYELTMAAGYFRHNHNPTVTFELFIRKLPPNRNYLIAAGIEQSLQYIQNLRFSDEEIDYLKALPSLQGIESAFFDYLSSFRFSGNVYGLEEGSLFFPQEPVLQIQAPLIEAQILETFLLTTVNFQSMIASKSARVVHASQSDGKKRVLMEFGSRRAHGAGASVLAARAAYLAGFAGTSNVLAGYEYGIPVFGTTAHSWTLAFDSEQEAFEKYREVFPDNTIYLIDTFDIDRAIQKALNIGKDFFGVRIDSGNLEENSKKVRKILDENGYTNSKIVLSGDLNEYKIDQLVTAGTPVDAFGVGTQVATSADAPYLAGVYKLVERNENGEKIYRAKFSEDKKMLPGRKQVYRIYDDFGKMLSDEIQLVDEPEPANSEPLLKPLLENGFPVHALPTLEKARVKVQEQFQKMPVELQAIHRKVEYPVGVSGRIMTLSDNLKNDQN